MKKLLIIVGVVALLASASEDWHLQYEAFAGKEIKDLDGWVAQNQYKATKELVNKCGDVAIVGGYKAFGKKATILKQVKVPPHYKLKVQVQLWKIDTWENEKMQVYVDGFLWEARWGFTEGGQNLCGGDDAKGTEKIYDIEFVVPHNSPQATIIMTSTLDEDADNESWGFRNFKLFYLACPGECGICHSNNAQECRNWDQVAFTWAKPDVALEDWKLNNGNARATECSGINIFGGPNNIGKDSVLERAFQNLPPHYRILGKFQFWKVDSWDNEEFRASLDGKLVFSEKFHYTDGVELCGKDTGDDQSNKWAEKVVNVEFQVPHQMSAALVSLTSTLDEGMDNESWGIRDFFLFVARCSKFCTACTGPGPQECTACHPSYQLLEGSCKEDTEWIIETQDFQGKDKFTTLAGWELNKLYARQTEAYSDCGDYRIVGGHMKFGDKAIAVRNFKLPDHTNVRFKVQLWKIDEWNGEELFIKVDGEKVWSMQLGWNDPGQVNLCGENKDVGNWNERIIDVDQIIPHKQKDLKLEISSTIKRGANLQAWGFRDFMMMYEPVEECIILFSECNFQGDQIEFCKNTPSFQAAKINIPIKSIKIPQLTTLIGFADEEYKGGKVEFTQSQECIEDYRFSFIQIGQHMRTRELNANLRVKKLF